MLREWFNSDNDIFIAHQLDQWIAISRSVSSFDSVLVGVVERGDHLKLCAQAPSFRIPADMFGRRFVAWLSCVILVFCLRDDCCVAVFHCLPLIPFNGVVGIIVSLLERFIFAN